jgi:hypothetical protein
VDANRGRLAVWWGSFVLLWHGAALVLVGPIYYLACNAENLELQEGSARETYCGSIGDFYSSGEPSEWTTPFPYVLPIAVLAVVGAGGIWRQSKGFLSRAAIVAGAALIGHVALLVILPG